MNFSWFYHKLNIYLEVNHEVHGRTLKIPSNHLKLYSKNIMSVHGRTFKSVYGFTLKFMVHFFLGKK